MSLESRDRSARRATCGGAAMGVATRRDAGAPEASIVTDIILFRSPAARDRMRRQLSLSGQGQGF